MELKLVKQGKFLGTVCNFYKDEDENIFMSRTQIGYALKYKDPSNAVKRIHTQYKERLDSFSVEVTGVQFIPPLINNKNNKIYMYTEKGIYEVCRKSRQKIADDFYDWVYDKIQEIKKNGYYIATEKDEQWLGARKESKETRKEETSEIKAFVEYAKAHGSSKPSWYYKHFTNLVRNKLDIPQDLKRDDMSQKQLRDIMSLETIISMKLPKLINKEMHYKDIYNKIKELIESI